MLGAVVFGHEQMQVAINAIRELAAQAASPPGLGARRGQRRPVAAVAAQAAAALGEAYSITRSRPVTRGSARSRSHGRGARRWRCPAVEARKVADQLGQLEYEIVRRRILAGEPRIAVAT